MIELKNGSGDITIKLWGSVYNTNLLEAYNAAGSEFVKYIDGDFALLLQDKRDDIMLVAVDAFASKPLWVGKVQDIPVVTEYPYGDSVKMSPNTAYIYGLNSCNKKGEVKLYDWDLTQNVNNYDKWIEVFEEAIHKRTMDVEDKLFIGLSSGYDSGAIACELKKQNVPFDAYTLLANETIPVLAQRQSIHGEIHGIQKLTIDDYVKYREYVIYNGIDYTCPIYHYKLNGDTFQSDYNYKYDKASAGDAFICEVAKNNNKSIILSGQGSDEIISDYGWNGRQRYSQSQLGGLFPDDLSTVFPYGNFDKGTMDAYIAKVEFIGNLYGIEARYPFLDVDLVQEFLHLTPELKNKFYKAPLHEYLTRNNYPFDIGVKKGFRANCNLSSS